MVQIGGGFVRQDELGVGHQRPGHGHPLLLSAGDLVGIFVLLIRHAHGLQQGGHPVAAVLPAGPSGP